MILALIQRLGIRQPASHIADVTGCVVMWFEQQREKNTPDCRGCTASQVSPNRKTLRERHLRVVKSLNIWSLGAFCQIM